MTTNSVIARYNAGTNCESSLAEHYHVKNGNTIYLELEGTGSVSFCIQTAAQQAAGGGCGAASGSTSNGPGCPSGTSTLTFNYAGSGPNQCFRAQQTTNGERITTSQRGFITSDLLSNNQVTTFYVTIESLSGAAAGVGMVEINDGQGCSTSDYPSNTWLGSASAKCKGDFLTFYTSIPSGTTSAITSTMTIGRAYKYVVYPNAASNFNPRCGEVTITGIINFFNNLSLILQFRLCNELCGWKVQPWHHL